jgi:hypothetical protein
MVGASECASTRSHATGPYTIVLPSSPDTVSTPLPEPIS